MVVYGRLIALKLYMHISSCAAEMPFKFQSGMETCNDMETCSPIVENLQDLVIKHLVASFPCL